MIRIEKRAGGEDRFQAPLTRGRRGRRCFMQMNRNKRGMTLDPMKPGGPGGRAPPGRDRRRRGRQPAAADPGGHEARLRQPEAIKPDIILTMVTAYGQGGPYSDRVGFDGIGQVMSRRRLHDLATATASGPTASRRPGSTSAPPCTAPTARSLALMARAADRPGQVVEGALLATALTVGNALLIEQAVLGINREPTGNRGQTAAPVDIFKTRDGWILVQVVGQPLFRRWAELMGEDRTGSTDPRFKDDISRGDNGAVDLRTHEPLVRRAQTSARGAGHPRQGDDPGRPGAEAAADPRRPPRAGDGLLPAGRLSRPAAAGAARARSPWRSPTRPARSATARRRWASTPTPSWPNSAMTPRL